MFVDEVSCIGCKQCVWCASATFRMEPEYGRSRVFAQWVDSEPKIQVRPPGLPAVRGRLGDDMYAGTATCRNDSEGLLGVKSLQLCRH